MTLIKRNNGLFPNFDHLWNDFFSDDFFPATRRENGYTVPAVNVREEDGQFVLEVAAPGLKKEDFNLEVNDNLLTLSTQQEEKHEEQNEAGQYTRREFRYQAFRRSFTLPETVDSEQISAKYEDGVLHVHLPKQEAEARPVRTIEIG